MENNKKYMIIAIIIQAFCILGLTGYILYDKVLYEDNNSNANINNSTNNLTNENKNTTEPIIGNNNAPVTEVQSLAEVEKKLGIKVPFISNITGDIYYTVYNEGWPFYADITYSDEARFEISKQYDDLILPRLLENHHSKEKKTFNNIEVTIWQSNISREYNIAVWEYNNYYYSFGLRSESSLNLDNCVNNLITQIIENN